MIEYKNYRNKIFNYVMTNRHLMAVNKTEASDQLFFEMKQKDNEVREKKMCKHSRSLQPNLKKKK